MINTILSTANDSVQNVYIPLPSNLHIGFCVIATIVYILEVYRKRSPHYLLLMLAVDATLLMQVFPNSTMVVVLAVLEVLLLGSAAAFAIIRSRKKKAAAAAAETAAEISDEGDTDENSDT